MFSTSIWLWSYSDQSKFHKLLVYFRSRYYSGMWSVVEWYFPVNMYIAIEYPCHSSSPSMSNRTYLEQYSVAKGCAKPGNFVSSTQGIAMTCSAGSPRSDLVCLRTPHTNSAMMMTETHRINNEKYPIFAIGGRIFLPTSIHPSFMHELHCESS